MRYGRRLKMAQSTMIADEIERIRKAIFVESSSDELNDEEPPNMPAVKLSRPKKKGKIGVYDSALDNMNQANKLVRKNVRKVKNKQSTNHQFFMNVSNSKPEEI